MRLRIAAAVLAAISLAAGGLPAAEAQPVPPPAGGLEITQWGWSEDPPPAVPDGRKVVDVANGVDFQVALLDDGGLMTWGMPDVDAVENPPQGHDFVAIDAGVQDGAALTDDGHVVTWGLETAAQSLEPPAALADEDVVQVAIGYRSAMALTADGKVYAWGSDARAGETEVPATLDGARVTSVAAGLETDAALTEDGRIVTWGSNPPVVDPAPAGTHYVSMSVGPGYVLALTDTGRVLQFGDASFVTPLPASVTNAVVTQVSAGNGHAMALTKDGALLTWANQEYFPDPPPADLAGRTVRAFDAGEADFLVATDGAFRDVGAFISGTPAVGSALAASATSAPSTENVTFTWLRDGSTEVGTGASYTPVHSDAGHDLSVRAVLHKTGYDSRAVNSASLAVPLEAFPTGGTVSTAGSPLVGSDLTGSFSAAQPAALPDDTTVSWSWRRDDGATTLPDATRATYTPTTADLGHTLTPTAVVTAAGYEPLTVSGTPSATVRRPAADLSLTTSTKRPHRGQRITVTASGLAPREAYRLTVAGHTLGTGYATSTGHVTRKVTVPRSTPLGSRVLRITGSQADRTGTRTLTVRR